MPLCCSHKAICMFSGLKLKMMETSVKCDGDLSYYGHVKVLAKPNDKVSIMLCELKHLSSMSAHGQVLHLQSQVES